MVDLSKYSPRYGGLLKSDGTVINEADLMSDTGVFTRPRMASGNRPADDPHSRIHQGVMYHTGALVAALADTASFNVILTTPADDYPHAIMSPSLDGSMDSFIFEGAAFTGGTSLSIVNLNRNSSNTFGGSAVHTPTISDDGTQLTGCHISGDAAAGGGGGGGGGGGRAMGGTGDGFDFEYNLKPSTNYLFRITNVSGVTRYGGICLYFYSAPLIA